ncbi:MAG: cytochrome c family protein [Planctomycetes bacterium]|nr:cytochrome c family protein [Planctomycetota bacterium]
MNIASIQDILVRRQTAFGIGVMVGFLMVGCVSELTLVPDPTDQTDGADGTDGTEPGDSTDPTFLADPTAKFDPLSRPESPTLSPENFNSAKDCAGCHPTYVAEWENSMHAYATVDPVWRVLVDIRKAEFDGAQDQMCVQCHTAIGTRGGEVVPGFSWDDLSEISLEGVTCEACHKVSGMRRIYNSGHELDETGPLRGTIEDPVANSYHESEYSELFGQAKFCGGCHDIIDMARGLQLERPYEEFLASPAAKEGRNCQTCHMPTYTGKAAIIDGVPERTLHRHRFIGAEVALDESFTSDPEVRAMLREEVDNLLRTAAEITVEAAESVQAGQQLDLLVTVRNLIDAHNLPTGSTFLRQCWVAITVTDAEGNILYQTGHLDEDGDLRNYWSSADQFGDADLIEFGSRFIDETGNPTLFPWLAAEHISSALSPLYERTFTLFVPTTPDTVGPITIDAAVRFRPLPPFLLRALGAGALVENLVITNMDEATRTVEVTP